MNTLILDGLPNITTDKAGKLKAVLIKKVSDLTKMKVDFDLIIEENDVKNFVLINHKDSKKLAMLLNDFRFDKKNTLTAVLLEDFNDILLTPDKYVPIDYSIKDSSSNNIYDYIDAEGCSQFIIHTEDGIDTYRNEYELYNQTDFLTLIKNNIDIDNIKYLNMSNTGTFLAIIKKEKVILYAQQKYIEFTNFNIKNIVAVKFSPKDGYIILYDHIYVYIYHILTNKLVKKIKTQAFDINFTYNDDFFVFKSKSKLGILDITKKTLQYIENVDKIAISNKSNLIVYFKYYTDKPSQINILDLDNMDTLLTKNIYDVTNIDFHWNDKKLIAIVSRNGKPDMIHIFNLYNKEIESKIIELDNRCVVFSWCKMSNKFIIIDSKNNLIVFNNHKEVLKIKNKKYKQIIMNPLNDYVLLSNIFYDNEIELFNLTNEESIIISFKGCTNIQWDPTSRFFILFSSKYFINKNNSYKLYTFQGDLIHERNINKLLKICWRPVPRDIISDKIKNRVKNNDCYNEILENIIQNENSLKYSDTLMGKRLQLLKDFRHLERIITFNI